MLKEVRLIRAYSKSLLIFSAPQKMACLPCSVFVNPKEILQNRLF